MPTGKVRVMCSTAFVFLDSPDKVFCCERETGIFPYLFHCFSDINFSGAFGFVE